MARLIIKAINPNTLLNIDSEGSLGGKFIDNELIDLGHIVTRLWWFRIVWGNAGKQLKAESAVSDLKGFRGEVNRHARQPGLHPGSYPLIDSLEAEQCSRNLTAYNR
jgi:hypothetical protein